MISAKNIIFDNVNLFRCPICGKLFEMRNTSLVCKSGHCFDCNKRGYVNFVPSQAPTKYDAELFEARHRIVQAGFYNDLIEKIGLLVGQTDIALDAGCGDGYFSSLIPANTVIGVDLSKEAIALAAKHNKSALWLVGDLTRLPLAVKSVSSIVNILSPAHYPEFNRVLKPHGRIIKVIPNEHYLVEIRQLANKGAYSNLQVKEHFQKHVKKMDVITICKKMPVDSQQASDFVRMTPMTFSVDTATIDIKKITEITISLEILIGTL